MFHEINLLRRVAVDAKLENPTSLFWSIKQLDRSIKGIIVKYRARSEEKNPQYNRLLQKLFGLRKRVEFDQPKYKLGIKSTRKLMPKQALRIMLPGLGPFTCFVVENLNRYIAVSYPEGPKLPDGFSWKNHQRIMFAQGQASWALDRRLGLHSNCPLGTPEKESEWHVM